MWGMEDTISAQVLEAGARWIEWGWTSATNPIHQVGQELFLAPLGIDCDFVEFIPVFDETPSPTLAFMRNPRWNRDRVNPRAAVLFPVVQVAEYFQFSLAGSGRFSWALSRPVPRELLPLIDSFGGGEVLNRVTETAMLSVAKLVTTAWIKTASHQATENDAVSILANPREYALKLYEQSQAARRKEAQKLGG